MSEEQPVSDEADDIDWMGAGEALEYLRHRGVAPWVGEPEVLYLRLKARLVRASAKKGFIRSGREMQPLQDGEPIIIPQELWESLLSVTEINWIHGEITAWCAPFKARLAFRGIEFARQDIQDIAGATEPLSGDALQAHIGRSLQPEGGTAAAIEGVLLKSKKGAGGAPKDDAGWTAYWHALIELALDGRLTKEHFPSRLALRAELCLMINEALSERTIKAKTSQVYRRFIDPSSNADDD